MTVLEILRPLTTHHAQQRGWQYLSRVHALSGDARSVTSEVHGSEVYDVEIRTVGDTLRVWCSCPYFADRASGCKHLWATAVLAHENGWLTDVPSRPRVLMDFADAEDLAFGVLDDEERAAQAEAPITRPVPPSDWEVALAAVVPAPGDAPSLPVDSGRQLVYVLTAAPRATTSELPLFVEEVERRRDGSWSKPRMARLAIDDIPHLPDADDRWALALIHATAAGRPPRSFGSHGSSSGLGVTYLNGPLLEVLLPRLCATGRVRLRVAHPHVPVVATGDQDGRLRWDDGDPWRLSLVVTLEHPEAIPLGADEQEHDRSRAAGREAAESALAHMAPADAESTPAPSGDDGAPAPMSPSSGVTVVTGGTAVEIAAPATRDTQGYRVDAVLTRGGRRVSIHEFPLLTDGLAVLDHTVARFDPAGGFAWAGQLRARGALVIPAASRRALVESLARSAVEQVELPDELRWEERRTSPRFAITIGRPHEGSGTCAISLAVEYDGTQAPLGGGSQRLLSAEGRVMYLRDRAAEAAALDLVSRLGVANADAHLRRAATIGYRKVAALVHALVDAGWLVQAEGIRYRTLAAPRLRLRSGIDWFDVETQGEAGVDIAVPELLAAIKTGQRMVTLGDGTIGMLPEEWLARVAPVLALGEANGQSMRFTRSQVSILDALLASEPDVDWDETFERARDTLRRFEGVAPEDPPPTFIGELREYQREALGWMRFLRDFGFGGCLADDMGLGKTVMVLAMLEARRLDPGRTPRPSLVVMPRSLIFNWKSEAERFVPGLRVVDFAHAERHGALDDVARADLVLTTYGALRRDVPVLRQQAFDYVVLDEAQAIKNAATATAKAVRLLRADHRLALTGTPVENHLGELQSLFDFLNPGLLGKGLFRSAAETTHDAFVERLAKGLRPFVLRRTKEHVTPELPPRTEETLYCELDGEQQVVYDELRKHYRQTLLKRVERDGVVKSRFAILEALLRLRQAACHTGLLPGVNGSHSVKFDLLLPRLAELIGEGRKALVFSQFTSLLALLRPLLDAEGIVYEYLDGTTRDRKAHVARFQEDARCSLFLISLKAGGVGLNLTAAEYVFLLDPWWNPAVELQAIDRTHRIGQDKPVFAYRLVACDTVEERILELQSQKRALADAILGAGTRGLRALQREDLERLLA